MNQRNNFPDLDNQKRKAIVLVICYLYTNFSCTIQSHSIEFKSFLEPWTSVYSLWRAFSVLYTKKCSLLESIYNTMYRVYQPYTGLIINNET